MSRKASRGDILAGGGHGGDRMALEEHLLARHDGANDVTIVDQHLAGGHELRALVLEVVARDDGLDARQRRGLRHVDALDAGMRMRRAQHLADELAGHLEVGAELGAAGHLVGAIGTDRTGADDAKLTLRVLLDALLHGQAPLISVAASMTALTILS